MSCSCSLTVQFLSPACSIHAWDLLAAYRYVWLRAAVLSDNGEQLWTATETNSSGGIAITGYKRRRHGSHAQWCITHSLASIVGVPREAHSRRVHLHILVATHSIAAVCCTGVVFVVPTEEGSASPLRISLVSSQALRSAVDVLGYCSITHCRAMCGSLPAFCCNRILCSGLI